MVSLSGFGLGLLGLRLLLPSFYSFALRFIRIFEFLSRNVSPHAFPLFVELLLSFCCRGSHLRPGLLRLIGLGWKRCGLIDELRLVLEWKEIF